MPHQGSGTLFEWTQGLQRGRTTGTGLETLRTGVGRVSKGAPREASDGTQVMGGSRFRVEEVFRRVLTTGVCVLRVPFREGDFQVDVAITTQTSPDVWDSVPNHVPDLDFDPSVLFEPEENCED